MPQIYKEQDQIFSPKATYKIISLLNTGNFAISYKAEETDKNIPVFLKQYIDPTPASGDAYKKFINHQEKVNNKLASLEIAEINYEHFEFDGCYFQAKEFMEGMDLNSALNNPDRPPSDNERFLIATVFMYGIRRIHETGIVHTDLKPQQIYLKHNPAIKLKYEVKIVDFDFCRIPGQSEPTQIAGTPFYLSPEHIRGETPDFKSDIFTCGIILYQILGGTEPHPGTTEEEYNQNVLQYKIDKQLKELNPDVSDDFSQLVYKMLDPNPSNRPDARTVHESLLNEIENLRERTSPTRPEVAETKPKIPIRIEFHHALVQYPFSVHTSMTLGRDNFRAYSDGYKYLETNQFQIIKTDTGWKIKGLPATNPTIYKGQDCTGKEIDIEDNSIIKIGELELTLKLIY